jgi:hypothetical protein
MLVVEGSLTSDTMAQTIKLSVTNNFYSTAAPAPVTGALVSVSDGDNNFILTETSSGIYQTVPTFHALANKTYQLSISNVDIDHNGVTEQYTAQSSFVDIYPLDSIQVKHFNFLRNDTTLSVTGFFQDNGAVQNYYMATLSINNVLVTDTITQVFFTDDGGGFNGKYFNGALPIITLNSKNKKEVLNNGDKVTLNLYGIPKDYYTFLGEISNSTGSNPFMGSPANVSTNILPAGKACGFFYTASARHASLIYKKPVTP